MSELATLAEAELIDFLTGRPWFRPRSRAVMHARVVEAPLVQTDPRLALAFVEVGFEHGAHELYQLPVGLDEDEWHDALADRELVRALVELIAGGETVDGDGARVEFHVRHELEESRGVTAMGSARWNSFAVLDDELILKVYRRLEAGINPELELLRFLTDRGFPNAGGLAGWYSSSSRLIDATLGVLRSYVPAESDGWGFALASLAEEPERFVHAAGRLGEVIGSMHVMLASETIDPAFAPEEPSFEALALLEATVDEEIVSLFSTLPDQEALEPIAGRGEEVRERVRLLSRTVGTGRIIRHHGDLHLREVLWTGDDWYVIDFEGQPWRTLPERRRKRLPLRDVATMLRSFAYAASASPVEPPLGWEERARADFLAGYFAEVAPSGLVPGGQAGAEKLLTIFELEQAVYELRYEIDNRPDWVPIPVAAIQRLLDSPIALTI